MRVRASPRKKCRVCELPAGEHDLVNGGLQSGWSPRSIAARFTSINRRDVANHRKNCGKEQDD